MNIERMIIAIGLTIGLIVLAACTDSPNKSVPTPFAIPTWVTPVVEISEPKGPEAPDFALLSATGKTVSLGDVLDGRDAAVIIFYRGRIF